MLFFLTEWRLKSIFSMSKKSLLSCLFFLLLWIERKQNQPVHLTKCWFLSSSGIVCACRNWVKDRSTYLLTLILIFFVFAGIEWKQDPHVFLSGSKDSMLYQHRFKDAKKPAESAVRHFFFCWWCWWGGGDNYVTSSTNLKAVDPICSLKMWDWINIMVCRSKYHVGTLLIN